MSGDRSPLLSLFLAQHGVITRSQAADCGMSPAAIRTRLARREWIRMHPEVFRAALVPMSSHTAIHAATLWAGPDAVLGGAAAAWWWGFTDIEPRTIELDIPRTRHLRPRPGVRIVRRGVPAEDVGVRERVRVVGPAFAALFGAVELGGEIGQATLDRALLRHVALADVEAALARNTGMRGAAQARRWVDAAAGGAAAETERIFARITRDAGIGGWLVNHAIRVAGRWVMPDFRMERARLIVELDGWAFHRDPGRYRRDCSRQNELTLRGWRVLRFTWADLTHEPWRVVEQVREALADQ